MNLGGGRQREVSGDHVKGEKRCVSASQRLRWKGGRSWGICRETVLSPARID